MIKKSFEEFSLETQQAIESFRKEYWQVYTKSHSNIDDFIKLITSSKYERELQVCINKRHIEGWLLAKEARLTELVDAFIFICKKDLWIDEFVKTLS